MQPKCCSKVVLFAAIVASWTLGCRSEGGGDDDSDGDADSDADADADADSDGDTDADMDADMDTDSDMDSDGDSDLECEGEQTDETCQDGDDNNDNGFIDCDDFCCGHSPVTVCATRSTIPDVVRGNVAEMEVVELQGVIVTAIQHDTFYIQDPDDGSDESYPDYHAIYVYIPRNNPGGITVPEVGDVINVQGERAEYEGTVELSFIRQPEVLSQGEALPDPEVVTPDEVGDEDGSEGERSRALEAVLVTVSGEVTDVEPEPGDGEEGPTNEFILDDALRVNDHLYRIDPMPNVGDTVTITGILHLNWGHWKIEPRSAQDVQ
ncbi:MAG: hypothetical protein HYY06_24605 [Deltaproteobacteria bacterium]|nr:hypothetical protein [Deltaproteobacteria bacterium]